MKKIELACIIDDDPIFIFGIKKMMALADFCNSFLIFHNGQEAINHLKPLIENHGQLPDVILLDLNMPIMDGWNFLDEFTKIETPKPITIYIVSSSINSLDLRRAKDYENVTKYLVKPISMADLTAVLTDFSN